MLSNKTKVPGFNRYVEKITHDITTVIITNKPPLPSAQNTASYSSESTVAAVGLPEKKLRLAVGCIVLNLTHVFQKLKRT